MKWSAFLVVMAIAAPDDEAAIKDRKALQGEWRVVAGEQDGAPLNRIVDNSLLIEGDKFTIKTKTSDLKGTIELFADGEPKGMDLTHTEGAVMGSVWFAIYSLQGNELKICYKDPNPLMQRPGEFATQAGSSWLLVTLKRAEP
jgi:uncharacterized protein (TIGR03067 family)